MPRTSDAPGNGRDCNMSRRQATARASWSIMTPIQSAARPLAHAARRALRHARGPTAAVPTVAGHLTRSLPAAVAESTLAGAQVDSPWPWPWPLPVAKVRIPPGRRPVSSYEPDNPKGLRLARSLCTHAGHHKKGLAAPTACRACVLAFPPAPPCCCGPAWPLGIYGS